MLPLFVSFFRSTEWMCFPYRVTLAKRVLYTQTVHVHCLIHKKQKIGKKHFFFSLSLFFSEMSGTGEEISQVHWKQQWLENGTLYFHVSMTESELLAQTTQPTAREPAHVLHEHMHLLHISVMVSSKH